jgi:hypothetical protein
MTGSSVIILIREFDGIQRFFLDIKTVLVSYKTVIRLIKVFSYTRRTGKYITLIKAGTIFNFFQKLSEFRQLTKTEDACIYKYRFLIFFAFICLAKQYACFILYYILLTIFIYK